MLLIKNGRVVDTVSMTAQVRDILIKDGRIAQLSTLNGENSSVEEIDAGGCIVAPGLVDMHVHFRDPGFTYKEDVISGSAAAAAGGVTTVVCMPNTSPVLDNAAQVGDLLKRAEAAVINVLTYGAVTLGQKGSALTNAAELQAAGAVGLSDDGLPVMNAALLREAMTKARELGLFISSHCEDADLVKNYAVNEGPVSKKLGIPGRPAVAEELMAARDALLAKDTGAHVHIAHVSTAGTVDVIRKAKAAGIRITAETCPQYFTLTEDAVLQHGTMARVNPPLRTAKDVEAVIEGLIDGTLDVIATDHAPHSAEEKARSLESAMSGMVGLETSLGLALTMLYHSGKMSLEVLLTKMSAAPAAILGIQKGRINIGDDADIVIFDPNEAWTVDPDRFLSKGRNTPMGGMALRGKVKCTIAGGKIVYKDA